MITVMEVFRDIWGVLLNGTLVQSGFRSEAEAKRFAVSLGDTREAIQHGSATEQYGPYFRTKDEYEAWLTRDIEQAARREKQNRSMPKLARRRARAQKEPT